MANVLPRETQRDVRSSYRARFVLVGSLVFGACGIVSLLALVPAYAIVSAERNAAADTLISLPPSTDREDLSRAQALARELKPAASSTISLLPVLGEILSARPQGVAVSSMHITRGDPGTISLTGTAPSRDEINAYRAILAENPRFEDVSVPIGTLTGPGNGSFSATLSGVF